MSAVVVAVILAPVVLCIVVVSCIAVVVLAGANTFKDTLLGDSPPRESWSNDEDDEIDFQLPNGFELTTVEGWKGIKLPAISSSTWKKNQATVIFLHGFLDTCDVWVPFMKEFHKVSSQELNFLAITLRGSHERAIPNDNDLSMYACAQDVINVIVEDHDRFSPNSTVHIVGHDWGAHAAQLAVKQSPDKFASLVILSWPHVRAVWNSLRLSYLPFFWFPILLKVPFLAEYWLTGKYKKVVYNMNGTIQHLNEQFSLTKKTRRRRRSSRRGSNASSTSVSSSGSARESIKLDPLETGTTFYLNGGRVNPKCSKWELERYHERVHNRVLLRGMLGMVRQNVSAIILPGIAQSWFGELVFGHSIKLGSMLAEAPGKIRVRTLQVSGRLDRLVPPVVVDSFAHSEDFVNGGVRQVRFSGAGHWPHLEAVEDLAGTLHAWTNVSFSGIDRLMKR